MIVVLEEKNAALDQERVNACLCVCTSNAQYIVCSTLSESTIAVSK